MSQRVHLLSAIVTILISGRATTAEPLDPPALVRRLNAVIDQHPTARRTTVSLKVMDLESGAVLYDRLGARLLTPASNLKIYTTACALDVFGPDHRFPTRLTTTAPIQLGTLAGDLVLVGGGDAMLSSEDLSQLADRVIKELGVARIRGRVVVDNSRYAPPLKGPGWMWDDDPSDYNMPVTPLMVDFNVLAVRLIPGSEDTVRATLVPAASYPPRILIHTDGDARVPQVTRTPFTETIQILTHGPLEKPVERRLTMHDPARWSAAMLKQMLLDRGVQFLKTSIHEVVQQTPSGDDGTGRQLVHHGVNLAETIKHFNRVSENAVGEVLLHEIAIAQGVLRPDWPDGARAISQWLVETAGLPADSFRLVDGSGLSRYNLISADSSVTLLAFMHQQPTADLFRRALPVYAVDLKDIDWPTSSVGELDPQRVSAKPGGMSGVSTISGYLRTLDGRDLAFSLLANGYLGSSAPVRDLRGQVWRTMVQYRAPSGVNR